MQPISLYIHMPWCIRKCPYCDFNSHKSSGILPEQEYIQALIADLQADLHHFPARPLHSIFIGGGTPSLFSGQAYFSLFEQLQTLVPFSKEIEITMEANPGTIEYQLFQDYRQAGINRLSLGIQSFNPKHLQILGRIHDDTQAYQAIEKARQAGFSNLNLDIMHGLPQQTVAEGIKDLSIALAQQPEHLSWYQLTLEPNTVFYKQQPTLPTEEVAWELEQAGLELLAVQNYQRYEISAFCKDNRQSEHNLNYWLFGDYYGIGAGAHGKYTHNNSVYRTRKHRQPKEYLSREKPFLAAQETVKAKDLVFEFMLNTTRLQAAIPLALFTQTTGLELELLLPKLKQAEAKGLIHVNNSHWQITELGRRFTNNLQEIFLLSA